MKPDFLFLSKWKSQAFFLPKWQQPAVSELMTTLLFSSNNHMDSRTEASLSTKYTYTLLSLLLQVTHLASQDLWVC